MFIAASRNFSDVVWARAAIKAGECFKSIARKQVTNNNIDQLEQFK